MTRQSPDGRVGRADMAASQSRSAGGGDETLRLEYSHERPGWLCVLAEMPTLVCELAIGGESQ